MKKKWDETKKEEENIALNKILKDGKDTSRPSTQ
jgi:hypothetical protein